MEATAAAWGPSSAILRLGGRGDGWTEGEERWEGEGGADSMPGMSSVM